MELNYIFFTTLFLGISILIFLQENPVYSILYLILSFCCAAFILFCLGANIFGIFFILIYVGAIAVLFLFVVMMVDIKKRQFSFFTNNAKDYTKFIIFINFIYFSFTYFTSSSFSKQYNILIDEEKYKLVEFFQTNVNNNAFNIDIVEEMQYMGQVLFNEYGIAVYLAGFMLFIALDISICLTLDFKQNIKEASTVAQQQLSRNSHKFF